jgi:hypothetical protein
LETQVSDCPAKFGATGTAEPAGADALPAGADADPAGADDAAEVGLAAAVDAAVEGAAGADDAAGDAFFELLHAATTSVPTTTTASSRADRCVKAGIRIMPQLPIE